MLRHTAPADPHSYHPSYPTCLEDFYEARKLAEMSKRVAQLSYRLGAHGQQLRRQFLFPNSSENGFRPLH